MFTTIFTVVGLVLLLVAVAALTVAVLAHCGVIEWLLYGQHAIESLFKLAGLILIAIIQVISDSSRGG